MPNGSSSLLDSPSSSLSSLVPLPSPSSPVSLVSLAYSTFFCKVLELPLAFEGVPAGVPIGVLSILLTWVLELAVAMDFAGELVGVTV